MKNILLNAYAICPNKGSEPGMGWNWLINIAKYHKVFVITESEFKTQIFEALESLPQKDNIKIFFVDIDPKIRTICWNQGDYRFYYYYSQWQKRALKMSEEIISNYKIDLIHQLNMIGYREPGYLWKIKSIPFVWGPVGGYGYFPMAYTKSAGLKNNLLLRTKNVVNQIQAKHSPRVLKAAKKANILIGANNDAVTALKTYTNGKNVYLINETGSYPSLKDNNYNPDRFEDITSFDILWVGRFIYSKQLGLALRSISKLKHLPKIKFHVIGGGNDEQNKKYRDLAISLGIEEIVEWHGQIPNQEVLAKMRKSHLFFFTSVMEATSTVVLEAISNGLPILSFNTCGFGSIVDESIGDKIELTTIDQSVDQFATKIETLYNNPLLLQNKSKACLVKKEALSWDAKAREMVGLYEKAIELHKQEIPTPKNWHELES